MKKYLSVLLILVSVLFLFAGCGKVDTEEIHTEIVKNEYAADNLGYDKSQWSAKGLYMDEDVYSVIITSQPEYDETARVLTEEEAKPILENMYNRVIGYFEKTDIAVIAIIRDSQQNIIYTYEGKEVKAPSLTYYDASANSVSENS